MEIQVFAPRVDFNSHSLKEIFTCKEIPPHDDDLLSPNDIKTLEEERSVLKKNKEKIAHTRYQTLHEIDEIEDQIALLAKRKEQLVILERQCLGKMIEFDRSSNYPFSNIVSRVESQIPFFDCPETSKMDNDERVRLEFDFSLKTLKGHDDAVLCVNLDLIKNRLVTGSMDKAIAVWDLSTYEKLYTIGGHENQSGHEAWVKAILIDQERIISGSGDKTIKIWNISNGRFMKSLLGHDGGITSLCCDSKHLCSSSLDTTVKFWDKNTGDCLLTLVGHEKYVKCAKFREHATISGGGDGLKYWDKRSGENFFSIHTRGVQTFDFTDTIVYTASMDGELNAFDIRTGGLLWSKNFDHPLHSIHYQDDMLILGGQKMCPKLFDPIERVVTMEFKGHQGNVHSLHAQANTLVSGDSTGLVKLWKW